MAANEIHYTGRVNDLGDELCVILANSDWGDRGWMVCEEVRHPDRRPFRTPKVFFEGADEGSFEAAMDAAKTSDFYGYPVAEAA